MLRTRLVVLPILTALLWSVLTSISSAQQTPVPRSLHSGTQVSLNGQNLPAAWSQWQLNAPRIGTAISDAGVMMLGVELLNTNNAAKQPVRWFSQPSTAPMILSSWLRGTYRYLDVTQLAASSGWQFSRNGNTLQITTPTARVKAIRKGQQPWGERIVVDLDRPTPWQVTQQPTGWEIKIAAVAPPAPERASPASTSPAIQTTPAQTTVHLNLPPGISPRVSTLANPTRLVIDNRPDVMVERDVLWTSGLRWRQQFISLEDSRFPVVSIEMTPGAGLQLKPITSEPTTLVGIASLSKTAQRNQAIAAVNGGFFNRNNQLPLGAIRRDGRWLSSPILNRGAIAWNDRGSAKIARLSLQETITTSTQKRLPILTSNSGYIQTGISRYSSEWGARYTPLSDNETIVVVENNQVTAQLAGGAAGQTAFPIPTHGYLLTLRANNAAKDFLTTGTLVRQERATQPADFGRYPQILGAGPQLVQNRQIVLNAKAEGFSDAFSQETAVRSAIGITPQGNLIIATVSNRVGGTGPNLKEMARVMQQLNCIDALNLDGGSSSSLYLGGQLLNRSPRTAARVHNGLGVFLPFSPVTDERPIQN